MTKKELLTELEDRGFDFDTRALICDDVLDIINSQLQNCIVPKFKVGDFFIEYWDKEPSIYQYQGGKHFKCLNKKQGYHCDYVILGALLLDRDFIQPISKEKAEQKLKEMQ